MQLVAACIQAVPEACRQDRCSPAHQCSLGNRAVRMPRSKAFGSIMLLRSHSLMLWSLELLMRWRPSPLGSMWVMPSVCPTNTPTGRSLLPSARLSHTCSMRATDQLRGAPCSSARSTAGAHHISARVDAALMLLLCFYKGLAVAQRKQEVG